MPHHEPRIPPLVGELKDPVCPAYGKKDELMYSGDFKSLQTGEVMLTFLLRDREEEGDLEYEPV